MISSTTGVGSDVITAVQPIKSTSVVDENNIAVNDGSVNNNAVNSNVGVDKSGDTDKSGDGAKNDSLEKKNKGKEKELSEEDVSKMSDALNKFMEQSKDSNIKFDYCKELNRITMQVVNKKTNEVIKEFPPKKMLDVLIGIREWLGVILDKKV